MILLGSKQISAQCGVVNQLERRLLYVDPSMEIPMHGPLAGGSLLLFRQEKKE